MYPPTGNDNAMSPPLYGSEAGVRSRCRSFCFLEREGVRWTAFLITYQRAEGYWRGYFTFRSAVDGAESLAEVRTADLFVERSEEEVDARARGLGRPLVVGLLESAIETDARRRGESPDVQRWFREMLRRHSADRARRGVAAGEIAPVPAEMTLPDLRSQYEAYRLDQVAHLIALLQPDDFREIVELRLEGRRIDFNSRDRLQLAMSIVQEIEMRLPLPPFEIWVEDYLANVDEYDRYSRALHGSEEIP